LRTFRLLDVPSDDFRADRATVQARFSAFGVLLLCRKIALRLIKAITRFIRPLLSAALSRKPMASADLLAT
jgi:hypothetical protein